MEPPEEPGGRYPLEDPLLEPDDDEPEEEEPPRDPPELLTPPPPRPPPPLGRKFRGGKWKPFVERVEPSPRP